MKYLFALVFGFAVGSFLTIQYNATINQKVGQLNRESNSLTVRAEKIAKALSDEK